MPYVVKYTENATDFREDLDHVAFRIEGGHLEAPEGPDPMTRALLYIAQVGYEVWTTSYLFAPERGIDEHAADIENATRFATKEEAEEAIEAHDCTDEWEIVEVTA